MKNFIFCVVDVGRGPMYTSNDNNANQCFSWLYVDWYENEK